MRENLKNARNQLKLTQQQMADRLGLTLRHYQKIEYAEINGSFEVWDALEDMTGIHQRILRENVDTRHVPKENQLEHRKVPIIRVSALNQARFLRFHTFDNGGGECLKHQRYAVE